MSTDCCNERTIDGENSVTADSLLVEGPSVFVGPADFLDIVDATIINATDITTTDLTVTNFTLVGLTPSSAVQTDIAGGLTTISNTGTGSNVLATSPTLVTPNLGVASATSLTLVTPLAAAQGGTGQTSLALVTVGNSTNSINSTNSTNATNIAGGVTGEVPVQQNPSDTIFLSPSTVGRVLTSNGVGLIPSFQTVPTPASVASLSGGTTGEIPVQQNPSDTIFLSPSTAGRVLTSNGVGAIPSFQAVGTPNTALNVAGGSQGHILVQTALDTTEFVAAGAAQTVLISNGVGLTPGFAEYKPVNIAGGLIGYLPVQNAVNTTTFIAPGTSGQYLKSNGPGALPTYQSAVRYISSGTFTPTLQIGGVVQTSYVTQEGSYIIMGESNISQTRICQLNFRMTFTGSLSAATGPLYIKDIPNPCWPQYGVTGSVTTTGFFNVANQPWCTPVLETTGTVFLYNNNGGPATLFQIEDYGVQNRIITGSFTYII